MTQLALNADAIINDTTARNGLGKYLDEAMRDRFHELIKAFNDFGRIEEAAFPDAVEDISRLLDNRLKLAQDWDNNPEILQQEIKQPFFVIGNARAGTTFAQSILKLDDGHRTPCYWDTRNPSPPPGTDPAIDQASHQEAKRFIDYMLGKSPKLLAGHPYFDLEGYTESEDEFVYSTDLNMVYPLHFMRVPNMPQAVPPTDPVQAMQFHKKMLQQLQWKMPVKRWVGKGIVHQYIMPSLLEVFPDAVCFWMHRPPEQYIASLLELLEHQYKPFNGDLYAVDPHELVEQLHAGMTHFMSQPTIDDPRVHHIRFADFVANPAAVIAPIYEKSGIPFTAEYEKIIQQRINDPAHRSDRYGKFTYNLDKFGLKAEDLRRKFADYCDRFEL